MLLYEIYIKTFAKSNPENQFGDLQGIIERVDYIERLGVDAIWITPFYPSPLIDNGYDVASYVDVDPRLGTIEDFKQLINVYHKRGIKVFIDVVFNHSSSHHQWFEKAIGGDEKYQDYYIFRDQPLNNWESMFKGSCWTYVDEIDKYYLHRFAPEQPDLNYINEYVKNEVKLILEYWTNLGVDGFRFDVINFLITDEALLQTDNCASVRNDLDMPGIKSIITEWKEHLKAVSGKPITFIGEVGSEDIEILNSYVGPDLMDFVFTFNVSSLAELDITKLGAELEKTYKLIENPTIFFSSHDMSRFFTRLCKGDKQLYLMMVELICSLKGVKVLFQGDETMIEDFICTNIDEMNDIQSVNEYYELLKAGVIESEAFERAMKNNRDFSRNFIDFNQNSDVQQYVRQIINQYKTKFYQQADIEIVGYDEQKIKFTRSFENITRRFEFDFDSKKITRG